MRVTFEQALQLVQEVFVANGLSERHARTAADVLVEAEARGRTSHGLVRVPVEAERLRTIPWSEPTVRVHGLSLRSIDGGGLLGYVVGADAVTLAADIALEHAIACVGVSNVGHTGCLGILTHRLAARGLIGVALGHSMPLLAYPGRRGAVLGSNPISVGFPSRAPGDTTSDSPAFITDASMAAITRGDVLLHGRTGTPLPPNVAVDSHGRATTDPLQVEALLPAAGPKGAALALAVQALAVFAGGDPIPEPGRGYGLLLLALRPETFIGAERYAAGISLLMQGILDPASVASTEVRLPGAKGDARLARARIHGLELDESLWQELGRLKS